VARGRGRLRHACAVDTAADYDEVVAHGGGPGLEDKVLTAILGMRGGQGIIGRPRNRLSAAWSMPDPDHPRRGGSMIDPHERVV